MSKNKKIFLNAVLIELKKLFESKI